MTTSQMKHLWKLILEALPLLKTLTKIKLKDKKKEKKKTVSFRRQLSAPVFFWEGRRGGAYEWMTADTKDG